MPLRLTNALVLASALLLLAVSTAPAIDHGETYFRFVLPDRPLLDKLSQVISIDKVTDGEVYAYANDRELADFQAYLLPYDTLPHPGSLLQPRMVSQTSALSDFDSYPTYSAYVAMMYAFETTYPNICEIVDVGTSVNGHSILFARISDNVGVEEDEPEALLTSSMHGDETTGFILSLRLIDSLLVAYGTDPDITRLVDSLEIWINPLANPDGTYYAGDNTVFGARRYNANGVDLNRNFPDPAAGDHPDGNPWQPETQIMMSVAENHSIAISANLHGGAEVINYPWDTWSRSHADESWYVDVSLAWAGSAQANSPIGYLESSEFPDGITNGYAWYRVTGGRQDYMIYWHGGRELTAELSDVKLLNAAFLPAHWNYNKAGMLGFLENSLYGVRGLVTDALSGQPLAATVRVLSHDIDNSEVFTDPDIGDYHRMLSPGSYSFEYSAIGFTPDTVYAVTAVDGLSTRVDVSLQGLTGTPSLAYTGLSVDLVRAGDFVDGTVTLLNDGDGNAVDLSGILQTTDPYITIVENSADFPVLPGLGGTGESLTEFSFAVSSDCPPNHAAPFSLLTTGLNDFSQTVMFALVVNPAVEDFETADLTTFPWQMSGDASWSIDWPAGGDGFYSARSGLIGNDQSTSMSLPVNVVADGKIAFDCRVSSEASYDYLRFYIDGVETASWSGLTGWNRVSFDIAAGSRTLTWTYSKDDLATAGEDRAWIDRVIFPQISSDLAIATSTLPDWTVGEEYALQMAATGGFGPIVWIDSFGDLLSSGLTLSQSGLLSGIPSGEGTVSFTAGAMDAAGPALEQYLEFQINPSPAIVTLTIPDGARGVYYAYQLERTGGTPPVVWFDLNGDLNGSGLTLEPNGMLLGTPVIRDELQFTAQIVDAAGAADGRLFTTMIDGGCCVGTVGDANNSGDAAPTIGDISALIDLLFGTEQPLACYPEADINQSGGVNAGREDITIGDISLLIDHLFINRPPVPSCL
jgi:hypothetical protein